MQYTNYAVIVDHLSANGELSTSFNIDTMFETSSVMKLFIVTIFLMKVQVGAIPLGAVVYLSDMHLMHTDHWSRKRYGKKRLYSVSEVTELSIARSDAVATNMIIQYLGGKHMINELMKDYGYSNTLLTRPSFSGSSNQGRKYLVGRTTARDCHKLLSDIFINRKLLKGKYFKVLMRAAQKAPLHTSLFPESLGTFYHKTGTAMNGRNLTINDVGVVYDIKKAPHPLAIIVFLSTQTYSGQYFSETFFDRLDMFDVRLLKMITENR